MLDLCLAREHANYKFKCMLRVKALHLPDEFPGFNQLVIDHVVE